MTGVSARTPLRIKLVAVVLVLSASGLLVSGLAASTALHGYLQDRIDAQLAAALDHPGQLNDALSGDGSLRRGLRRPDVFGTIYVQVGSARSPLPAGIPAPALPDRVRTDRTPFTVDAETGATSWRVAASQGVERLTGDRVVIVVAVPLDEVARTVGRLQVIELVVGGGVLLLLALGGSVVVRRSLRPLVAVETTAEAIAAGDLSHRVPESDPRTEVGSLSQSFNAMVARIEQAFLAQTASESEARASEERMRRFVADASHELRTPLTSIRGFAELYRQGALADPADVDRAMSRVESEAARMGLLVEDLLLLARLDQQRPLERAPVDLLELARDAVQDARAVDADREIAVQADGAPVVLGDAPRLTQVFGNLVGNALAHSPSPVLVRVSTAERSAVVEVVDNGPGIPAQDRTRVFERFYRSDDSRTRTSGGSGLGLSIVAALVAAHHGTVALDETPGGGVTIRFTLPLWETYL